MSIPTVIIRVPQRGQNDCAICTVSMVMGLDYPYERVLRESDRYRKTSDDGKFLAWWEEYFKGEGFEGIYCRFGGLYALNQYSGNVVGMLWMDIPHLKMMHIVAVDELGVVDPADNAPDHVPLDRYLWSRKQDGVIFHDEWLAVRRIPPRTPYQVPAASRTANHS